MAEEKKLVHRGAFFDRTKINDPAGQREKVFAQAWEEENEARGHIPMVPDCSTLEALIAHGQIRDTTTHQGVATVVATIFQWLGSPVGFAFLDETLKKAGYHIVRLRK